VSAGAAPDTVPRVRWNRDALSSWCHPDTLLVSSPSARRAARDANLNVGDCRVVDARDLADVADQAVARVIVLGAGTVIDAATLTAHTRGVPLLVVPTVLSTDAAFSPVAAGRQGDTVIYHDTGTAEEVLLDMDLLLRVDWGLHLHGLGDVLAVESAATDWCARHPGQQRALVAAARSLVDTAAAHAHLWRTPSAEGLELLAELLITKVQLGMLAGHPGFEEGTEHYLAYYLEPMLTGRVWHGDLLTACLLLCSRLQQWTADRIDTIGELLSHLPGRDARRPQVLMPAEEIRRRLPEFGVYCQRHALENTLLLHQQPDPQVYDTAATAWERGW